MALCIIVDDHVDSREGLAEYLQVSGFDVLAVASAEECEGLLASNRPDAILLDLQLPRVDGWELATRIKADPQLRSVPLVAVSGCVMPADRARAAQVGIDRFLPKPCDPELVLASLRELLQPTDRNR